MAIEDNYNYSATEHFLEPFSGWEQDEPFISELPDLYGTLWQFRPLIADWTFGINRSKNYVYLHYQIRNTNSFLN
jgi:hypothetical protein